MVSEKSSIGDGSKINTLFILDEETKFLAPDRDKKKCLVITSLTQFNEFVRNSFKVKNVVILAELNWGVPLSRFYGYQAAKKLMNSRNRLYNFNIMFISVLKRETIYRIFRDKNRIFTQKFKHVLISGDFDLNKLAIPDISPKKFEYLKNYCLLESGILDRLEHDIRKLSVNPDEVKMQKVIEEIKVNRDILTSEIIKISERLEKITDIENCTELLEELHQSFMVLQSMVKKTEEGSGKKSHVKVMLIEDDLKTLLKLKEQLSTYFHNITTFQSGSSAFAELANNAKEYDVVITDMELLNGDFDDEKQGIDILELCEKKYPFIVTRIISALPKNALTILTGKRMGEIVFKSSMGDTVIPPFANLSEFVKKIDKDVQKRRQLRRMKGPEISWWGKYLTKQLYITKIENPGKYKNIWDKAMEQATRFIKGELDNFMEDEKIGIEFKKVKETVSNPESGWDIIDLLLTHRLIALWFSSKNAWKDFYYNGFSDDAYVNLRGFKQGLDTKSYKAYFNTFLGLSVESKNSGMLKIIPVNFFPEEQEWLSQVRSTNLESLLLRDVNDDFQGMLIDFMKAYSNKEISDEITFGEAMKLLDNFIEKYRDEKFVRSKYEILKSKFMRELNNFYGLIPSEAQRRIDKIKTEIFSV
jgi:CheY-like chemotaxis protein